MSNNCTCVSVSICIKDEGVHFHGIFGCCERATTWVVHSKFFSPLAIFWLAFVSLARTRNAQSGALHYQKLRKVAKLEQIIAEEVASCLEANCRVSTSPSIVSHHCVQWYKLARWMCQCMYSMFTFYFRKERVQTVQSVSKRSKSLLSYSADGRGTHPLHSDLKKAQ